MQLPHAVPLEHVEIHPSVEFTIPQILGALSDLGSSGPLLHVGAHRGQEVSAYLEAGIAPLILVEPIEDLAEEVERAWGPSGVVIVENCAVSDFSGAAEFHLTSNDGQSSSLLNLGPAHRAEAPQVHETKTCSVTVTRIDDLRAVQANPPRIVVLDCQGAELRALRGAERTLRKVDWIFTEVNRAEVYVGCDQIEELDSFLATKGFRRTLTRWWGSWGDALYVRSVALGHAAGG